MGISVKMDYTGAIAANAQSSRIRWQKNASHQVEECDCLLKNLKVSLS